MSAASRGLWRRLAALGLALAACSEATPPAAPGDPLPRIDAGASGPAVGVPEAVLDAWHVTAPDRRVLGGPVGVRAGSLRQTARIHALPAAWEVPVPAGARALRFRVSLGARAPRCQATVRARWGAVQEERGLVPGGGWQTLLLEGGGSEAGTLALRIEPQACRQAWAAVSEIRASGRATATPRRPDLLLVVLDTVRRDHFDCDEATAELMPHVHRSWCRRGLFLEDAWSTTSWTYPAVASMLTGLRPREHGALRRRGRQLELMPPRLTTLAEILRWSGYATGAVIANWQAGRGGLWRGFDEFVERHPREGKGFAFPDQAPIRRAAGVVDDALAWLEAEREFASGEPTFTWLLFLDAHEPVDAALQEEGLPESCRGVDPLPVRWQGIERRGRGSDPREPAALPCRRDLYREALRYLDGELGRLVENLEASGRAERTGIVVVADHGEEFWEHAAAEMAAGSRGPRGYGHGHTLFAELTHVPLLVVPPGGLASPVRRASLASVRDVFATLLSMAGVPAPSASRSLDLLRLLDEAEPPAWRRWLVSETTMYGPDRASVTTPELRAIRTEGRGVEVFDRRADPGETRPLPPESPLARRGAALLERTQEPEPRSARPTRAEREALRALGYVE